MSRSDRGALGEAGCLLQLVRGRDPAIDQRQAKKVQVGSPALVTSQTCCLRIRTSGLAIEPGSRLLVKADSGPDGFKQRGQFRPLGWPMGSSDSGFGR